jgi:hypothetical protein
MLVWRSFLSLSAAAAAELDYSTARLGAGGKHNVDTILTVVLQEYHRARLDA